MVGGGGLSPRIEPMDFVTITKCVFGVVRCLLPLAIFVRSLKMKMIATKLAVCAQEIHFVILH